MTRSGKTRSRSLLPLRDGSRREERESGGRRSLSKHRVVPPVVFLFACVGGFLALLHLYVKQFVEITRLKEREKEIAATLQREKLRFEKMNEEVRFLRTLAGVERLARQRLKYIKQDEVIIKTVERALPAER